MLFTVNSLRHLGLSTAAVRLKALQVKMKKSVRQVEVQRAAALVHGTSAVGSRFYCALQVLEVCSNFMICNFGK
jgi:hypothetical protein